MDSGNPTIRAVRSAEDLTATVELFKAYVAWLDLDLAFQNFEDEIKSMPGKYSPPVGELYLARSTEGKAIGCVAVRPFNDSGCCEMKRLYVTPEGRGLGAGDNLIQTAIGAAKNLGYQEMKLDTLPRMIEAKRLYERHGFREVEAYYSTPIKDTTFLTRELSPE